MDDAFVPTYSSLSGSPVEPICYHIGLLLLQELTLFRVFERR